MSTSLNYNKLHLLGGYLIVLVVTSVYTFTMGPQINILDSLFYVDRAKNLVLHGSLNQHDQRWIYPPLYSILISPAYLFSEPAVSHLINASINVAVFSSMFFPFCFLLRDYTHLSPKESIAGAVVLALLPTTLWYIPFIVSEVLYIPLLVWVAYALVRSHLTQSWGSFIGLGIGLTALLLTRTAAATVILSFLGFAGLDLYCRYLSNKSNLKVIVQQYIVAISTLVLLFGAWKLFEYFFLDYLADGPITSYESQISSDIWLKLSDPVEVVRRFTWLANQISYVLTSPLCIAPIFVLALLVVKPKLLITDPFIPFALLCIVGAAVAVLPLPPILSSADFQAVSSLRYGLNYTWSRYMVPYVFLWFLIALRYRQEYSPAIFGLCSLPLFILWLSHKPSSLQADAPHGSLMLFSSQLNPLGWPTAALDGLYFLWVMAVGALLLGQNPRLRQAGLAMFVIGTLLANFLSYNYLLHLNFTRTYAYHGIGQILFAKHRENPETQIFIDPRANIYSFTLGRIEFYLPFFIERKTLAEVMHDEKNSQEDMFYITDRQLLGQQPLATDSDIDLFKLNHGATYLYKLKQTDISSGKLASYSSVPLSGNYGSESAELHGQPIRIAWLQAKSTFKIDLEGATDFYIITAKLATVAPPRPLYVSVNDQLLADDIVIDRTIWENDYNFVSFVAKLVAGENIIEFSTPSAPTVLAPQRDNREVAFLLIDDLTVKKSAMDVAKESLLSSLPQNYPLVIVDSALIGEVGIDPANIRIPWATQVDHDGSLLWLGQGETEGLSGSLWSNATRRVVLEFEVSPGVDRSDRGRTVQLVSRGNDQVTTQRETFDGPAVLKFPIQLQAGRNDFQFTVLDKPAPVLLSNGDTRALLVLLRQVKIKSAGY